MSLRSRMAAWLSPPTEVNPSSTKSALKVSDEAVFALSRKPKAIAAEQIFAPYKPPPGVVPESGMAMDAGGYQYGAWASGNLGGLYTGGTAFFGYPYLAELSQRAEYRIICETIAAEMTRKWIEIKATGEEDDKSDKIAAIEAEFKRLKVREHFYRCALLDGFFGRVQIFIDLGSDGDDDWTDPEDEELRTPIGNGLNEVSRLKISQGSLKALRVVEPLWTYPYNYDAQNPLSPWWYKPRVWYVMGRQVHTSRLLTFVGREMPDLLKPAYSFGGLSLIQMAKPYVDKWIATAGSVADLVFSFTTGVLKTQMEDDLNAGGNGGDLYRRVALFSATRNNQGILAIDKDSEDYTVQSTPIAGLDALQAQALEHVSTVSQIPSVKWTGNEPAGLNASSEGTIRVFNDYIHGRQEMLFGPNLTKLLGLVQFSLFGEVDQEIVFEFVPLEEESEKDKAEIQKIKAETAGTLIDKGVLAPVDDRVRVANDPGGDYEGIDVNDLPDLRVEEEQGLEPTGGRPDPLAEQGGNGNDPFEAGLQKLAAV